MLRSIAITIDGKPLEVLDGTTVASAILQAGAFSRTSLRGESRQPMCGMGICYECRVEIDGRPHQRSCQIACEAGMRVITG